MAKKRRRKKQTDLELSWIENQKQWRKRYKNKTYYLGTGKGKDDVDSYRKALEKWRAKKEAIDVTAEHRQAEEIRQAIPADAVVDYRDHWQAIADMVERGIPKDQALRYGAEMMGATAALQSRDIGKAIERLQFLAPVVAPDADIPKTINDYLDDYLAEQGRRCEHGKQFPNAPQRERISEGRLRSYRDQVKVMRASIGNHILPADEDGLTRLVKGYCNEQRALMTADKMKANTYNERVKTIRHFIGWLYRERDIDEQPRELSALCAKYKTEGKARSIDLETIGKLWNDKSPSHDDNRWRCWLALGLNCGYYAKDIATLEHEQINGTHIIRDRHKTGVPTRMKLWKVTKRLLLQCKSKHPTLALLSKGGGPLMRYEPNRWSEIESEWSARTKRLKIKGVSFSNLRDTSATRLEKIDRAYVDTFLGHKDSRMARFYLDGESLDWSGLDAAVDELEKVYGLTL